MGEDNGTLLVRIDERVASLTQWRDKVDQKLEKIEGKLDATTQLHTTCSATQNTRWEEHDKEHEGLQRKSTVGDGVAGGLGAVALIVTALKELLTAGQP